MFVDFVHNNVGHGPVGEGLAGVRYDPGLLRPYFNDRGVPCVTINTGRKVKDNKTGKYVPVFKSVPQQLLISRGIYSPVFNATQMRKDEWVLLVRGAARLRFEDGTVELRPGDHFTIPAGCRHRVEWTSPDEPTVWVAVFYPSGKSPPFSGPNRLPPPSDSVVE